MHGIARLFEPLPTRGGEDALGVGGQRGEQAPSAVVVEFAEDVVEEVDRRRPAAGADEFRLGEAQGQGHRALLAFAGECPRCCAVEFERDIVAMRTDHGLAQSPFFLRGRRQGPRKIVAPGASVAQRHAFPARADGVDVAFNERIEFAAQPGADLRQVFPGGDQGSVVGRDFAAAVRTFLEQEIACPQGAFVGAEIFQISRVTLAAEKVEEAAAFGGGAADEFDVLAGKERDQTHAQVIIGFPLHDFVEHQLAPLDAGKVAGEVPPVAAAVEGEPGGAVTDGLREGAGARRLDTQQNANGLEQR